MIERFDPAELDDFIATVEAHGHAEKIVSLASMAEEVLSPERDDYQIHQAFGERLKFHPGELTVWCGAPGAGKSQLLGQYIAFSAEPSLICSFEMPLRTTVHRMARQVCDGDYTAQDFSRWAEAANIWLYDHLDVIEADRVIGVCRYAAEKMGVKQVVIDSLTKVKVSQDGGGYLTEQADLMNALQRLVKETDLQLHLVVHPRKGEGGKEGRKDMYDVRGAGQIVDLADRVLMLSRNWAKERIAQLDPLDRSEKEEAVLKQADACLQVEKQRSDGYTGEIKLDYHYRSGQYIPHGHTQALRWGQA